AFATSPRARPSSTRPGTAGTCRRAGARRSAISSRSWFREARRSSVGTAAFAASVVDCLGDVGLLSSCMPSREQLVQLYRDFDPAEPVSQATLGQFVERSGESAATIVEDLQLGLDPLGKWVITGSVGCGKSSELVKVAD